MRRIISLDGGGIRGIVSLQVLREVETHFRRSHGNPSLVLADVVDLFAGTSTGAIIATCLSWGMSVEAIERLYLDHGSDLFSPASWWRRLHAKYRTDAISGFFEQFFREADGAPALLGSGRLKTLLLIVMRNASTGSPWPVSNNPAAKFNALDHPDCNLRIPVWKLLRASTAAPTYFEPEEIVIDGRPRLFVDGGVSPFNNPALMAVLMATLPEYCLGWTANRTDLHVVSIGTGSVRRTLTKSSAAAVTVWDGLLFSLPALLSAVSVQQDVMCRVLGDCLFGAPIDTEIGSLQSPSLLSHGEKRFSYVRYDVRLDEAPGRPLTAAHARLDNIDAMPVLREVGAAYAAEAVQPWHFYPRGSATATRTQDAP